ncbi:hypothetical protein EVD20_14670 [Elizabethkingia bruuniana]|nr:hypothetical protein [Elizabethkingia bruuniana]QDZ63583.1 hypothetical protein EVD20_14670 [Elizabethkingia bruuniana]
MAKLSDLDMIVEIHYNRFSNFFLTTLGKKFLKTFYKAFLKEPGILIVLLDEGNIKGFAAGSINNQNFFKKLFKNNFLDLFFQEFKSYLPILKHLREFLVIQRNQKMQYWSIQSY